MLMVIPNGYANLLTSVSNKDEALFDSKYFVLSGYSPIKLGWGWGVVGT